MKRLLIVGFLTTACTPVAPLPAPPLGGKCSTMRLEEFVGKKLTVDIIHESMERAGVKNSRSVSPGQAVTMDYRTDRLNIYLDANGNIDRFTCG